MQDLTWWIKTDFQDKAHTMQPLKCENHFFYIALHYFTPFYKCFINSGNLPPAV